MSFGFADDTGLTLGNILLLQAHLPLATVSSRVSNSSTGSSRASNPQLNTASKVNKVSRTELLAVPRLVSKDSQDSYLDNHTARNLPNTRSQPKPLLQVEAAERRILASFLASFSSVSRT